MKCLYQDPPKTRTYVSEFLIASVIGYCVLSTLACAIVSWIRFSS
jgi:hypothetical protein